MAEDSKKPRRGCLPGFLSIFLFLTAVGLAVALYFASLPQDLSDIKGYGPAAKAGGRDLGKVVEEAIDRGFDMTISEEELNGWLKRSLDVKQGGLLEEQVKFEGIAVRLEKDRAEVVLERTVFGRPFTTSMYLRIEKLEDERGVLTQIHLDGGPFSESLPKLKRGGRIGRLVVPQGFLILVKPAFEKIGLAFPKESENAIQRMGRVRIDDGSLHLDPRSEMERGMSMPGTF